MWNMLYHGALSRRRKVKHVLNLAIRVMHHNFGYVLNTKHHLVSLFNLRLLKSSLTLSIARDTTHWFQ